MTQVPRQTYSRGRRRVPIFRRAVRVFLLTALFLIIICGGFLAYFYAVSSTVRDTLAVVVTREYTPAKAFPGQDQINLLFLGRDLDRDERGRIVQTRGRTDAIMLAHIDFRNRAVNILSIPRDTLVHVPGYRGKRRINSANALGGPELAQQTIVEFLGVQPDYYLLVNFDGFEKAIDAMGGLEIEVDKKLDYDDNWGNLHVHLTPGRQTLNGEQAMGFVRYRQSNDGDVESDFTRIGRQQELLCATKQKLKCPGAILKIPGILDTVRNDTEGNLTTAQMACLARFLQSLPAQPGIRMATLPAQEGGGAYVRADPEATRELVMQMFHDVAH